jgi:Putative beta-barrel porin-2, OmpL-like. bbp2
MMYRIFLTVSLLACSFMSLRAQDADSTKDEGKLTFSGYIDTYYNHAFNNPGSGNLMGNQSGAVLGGAPAGRAFDRLTDQFALGLVQTKLVYTNRKSEMVIDLTFGPNAELGNFGNQRLNASGGSTTSNGFATGFYPNNGYQNMLYGTSAAIKQAYFTYKATSKLSFTVGQFGTHVGYEVIDAPVNYHYSLSNLFNNGPFYHIGAKANYAVSDKIGLMVGLVNNWDALTDWKKQKSVISQLFISPLSGWNMYVNYIGGYNDDGFKVFNPIVPTGNNFNGSLGGAYNRHLWDLTTGYQITGKFYVGLNAAYGFYSHANDTTTLAVFKAVTKSVTGTEKTTLAWGGVALYANYAINDWLGIGARYEHFQDKYGVRYIGATNNSLTITAPITLASGHLILKPEFRMDTSPSVWGQDANKNNIYYYEKGSDGASTKTQTTLGMAVIYKY